MSVEGGGEAPTAGDYARLLLARAVSILTAAGHGTCEYLQQARYEPASGAVVCGCGEFEPWSDDPDSPPWAPGERSDAAEAVQLQGDADAADRAARAALAQRDGNALPEAADPIRSTLALIDPTEVYGPEDVERHILDTLYRLETGALFERETVVAAYNAEKAFNVKYNAFVADNATGGAADVRKAQAMQHCEPEYLELVDAKMMKEAVKQTMHNLRAVLSGYQSTARSVGSAYQAGGSQGDVPPRAGRPW